MSRGPLAFLRDFQTLRGPALQKELAAQKRASRLQGNLASANPIGGNTILPGMPMSARPAMPPPMAAHAQAAPAPGRSAITAMDDGGVPWASPGRPGFSNELNSSMNGRGASWSRMWRASVAMRASRTQRVALRRRGVRRRRGLRRGRDRERRAAGSAGHGGDERVRDGPRGGGGHPGDRRSGRGAAAGPRPSSGGARTRAGELHDTLPTARVAEVVIIVIRCT